MQATVICASRRYINLKIGPGKVISAMAESKAMDIVAGDEVEYDTLNHQPVVKKVLPRKNCLMRCYRKAQKKLAANLDLLLMVAAPYPLFNTSFIDRMIVASLAENINLVLVVNKSDIPSEQTEKLVELYKQFGLPILRTSAKKENGLVPIFELLSNPELSKVALAGISGVGKSTILNKLIPEAASRTNDVSVRTGQGKQTTSQALAYSYLRENKNELLIIDLPGLSNFGVTHIDRHSLKLYFTEFLSYRDKCQYRDCSHLKEPSCAVKEAVEKNEISRSRYQSYVEIVEEIEDAREY